MWNQNGQPRPPVFDRIKILIIMTLLQNIVISGAQVLLMSMHAWDQNNYFLIMMTRLQNIKMNVLWPGHLYQNFWSHQYQETLSTWNNNILQWGHDDQTCNEKQVFQLAANFDFTSGLFSSWMLLFYIYIGCFV